MARMKRKSPKRPLVSDQLRAAIRMSGVTVYKIGKDTGLDPRIIYRFLDGLHVTTATVDLLAERLGLTLVPVSQSERG
jgi:hypothetical protein